MIEGEKKFAFFFFRIKASWGCVECVKRIYTEETSMEDSYWIQELTRTSLCGKFTGLNTPSAITLTAVMTFFLIAVAHLFVNRIENLSLVIKPTIGHLAVFARLENVTHCQAIGLGELGANLAIFFSEAFSLDANDGNGDQKGRDSDEESHDYVRTLGVCVCLLFVAGRLWNERDLESVKTTSKENEDEM